MTIKMWKAYRQTQSGKLHSIVRVAGEDLAQAKDAVRYQLGKPGRRDFLKTWEEGGEITLLDEDREPIHDGGWYNEDRRQRVMMGADIRDCGPEVLTANEHREMQAIEEDGIW